MAITTRPVLIVGGGIGGLTASIALAERGLDTTVLERSTFAEESGAGIQLGPNATRLLRALGVLEAVAPSAFRPEAIWVFDGLTGRRLTSVPLGSQAEARYGAPYLTLHRADLHAALLSACKARGAIALTPGFAVAGVEARDEAVAAVGIDGARTEGSAVLGADGLWSDVRNAVAPGASLRPTSATASRALLPLGGMPSPFDAPVVGLWLGPRAHLVHYPVRSGEALNVVAVTDGGDDAEGWNRSADREALLCGFTGWCKESKSLLERAEGWRAWSLYRLAPLPRWSRGRVALLGDAAHPVLPFLAQGAALAIEDAVALAATLAETPADPAAAFRRYEDARRPRASRVQRQSKRFGRLYHLRGPARLARNFALARRTERTALDRFDWLYGEA